MFRAISYFLWRTEEEHRFLRSMVVQQIKENWEEYAPFVQAEWGIMNRDNYCDYMEVTGTFTSELECTVATKLYHLNLSIYREIAGKEELKRVFHSRVGPSHHTIRLLFTGNADSGHYDLLLPE